MRNDVYRLRAYKERYDSVPNKFLFSEIPHTSPYIFSIGSRLQTDNVGKTGM